MAGVPKKLKQSDDMQTGSINSLKPEELILILEKVNRNEKRSLSKLSKDFLKANCFISKRLTWSLPCLLDVVLPCSPNLLAFTSWVPLRNSDMKLLAVSCPELKVLLLGRERDLVPLPMDVDFDDDGLSELASCSNLVEVVLTGRIKFGDLGVISLVTSVRNLQKLSLEGCVNVGDESLRAIGNLTSLNFLNVSGCNLITDDGLKHLTKGKVKNSLKSLDLSNCGTNITDDGITELSKITGLRELDLSMLVNVTDVSLFDINCNEIENLYLNGCVGVTGEILPYFTKLVNLQLVNCPNISWEDVEDAASSLEELECLVLDRRMMDPMPPAGLKQRIRFGVEREKVTVTWK